VESGPGTDRLEYARLGDPANEIAYLFEPRWLMIGLISGKHRSVVVTYRGQRVRIISARRSRKEEEALYEG